MNLKIYGNKQEGFKASGISDNDDTLKACPFCASTDIIVEYTHTPHYQAQCLNCDASGPTSNSVKREATTTKAIFNQHRKAFDEAVRFWNNREIIGA